MFLIRVQNPAKAGKTNMSYVSFMDIFLHQIILNGDATFGCEVIYLQIWISQRPYNEFCTAKIIVIPPYFLVWTFCIKEQLHYSDKSLPSTPSETV